MPRTIVYIDGFNLYYRALKGTAHISGRVDPEAPRRQHAYLRALATIPKVAIHYGNFLVTQKWAGLVQPPDFRPPLTLPAGDPPQVAYVWKTEETGSDVNLGVHLVRDAFRSSFDLAAVLTNDTDLMEPIRIVTQELGIPVTLLSPSARPAASLANVVTNVRHVQPYIGPCQLPDPILVPGKKPIRKPREWRGNSGLGGAPYAFCPPRRRTARTTGREVTN